MLFDMTPTITFGERISDIFIYVVAIIPLMLLILLVPTCTPASGMFTNCFLGSLGDSVVQFFDVFAVVMAAGGWMIVLPLLLIASIVSIRRKVKRYKEMNTSVKKVFYAPPFIFLYVIVGYVGWEILSGLAEMPFFNQ